MLSKTLLAVAFFASAQSAFSSPTNSSATTCTDFMSKSECSMWSAINKVRARHRVPLLGINSKCVDAAGFHANAMATRDFFSHDGPRETWSRRMVRFDLDGTGVGENIAWGADVQRTVSSWMRSPGHRRNILQKRYKSTGLGLAIGDDGRKIWVQCFTALSPE